MRLQILEILTNMLNGIETDELTITTFEYGNNKSILIYGEKWNVKITVNDTDAWCSLVIKDSKRPIHEPALLWEIFYITKTEWVKFLGIPLFKRVIFDSSDKLVVLFDKLYDKLYTQEQKAIAERQLELEQIKKRKQAEALDEVTKLKI